MATVYLESPGLVLRRRGGALEMCRGDSILKVIPMADVDSVVVSSWAKITTPLMMEFLERGISVHYLKPGGRYMGSVTPARSRGWEVKMAQYETLRDEARRLNLARSIVLGKLLGQRLLLQRSVYRGKDIDGTLLKASTDLKGLSRMASMAEDMDYLRGLEGHGAAIYFASWPLLLRPPWSLDGRNRRPPRDPVNAMLSFGYTLLVGVIHNAVIGAGLDPLVGYLHPPFRNRSSLVLDLMEEFRPAVIDRAVISLCNRGDMEPHWFELSPDGVTMTPSARRRLISSVEDRLNTEVTDRGSGITTTFRRHADFQARRWASALKDDEDYRPLVFG
ncbi:CRISPR-associated endonuclease Cas1 [Dethiosulfovibrio salsuginis]|uniref:CRISPR-associated endonuclease Cas1 n=1 Tax=Dethiosulfovibrio salsuginis TaxID=561720 RepID=A0A1X7KUU1_9BACT|nr:CRISPR-associated endonuclease Cas1 [Dethiosulfovibrio salsuginis]SMG45202.1 CRISPR-associated protein, Cas1 family [Dethiosulfovibrio salsuginis]